MDVIAVIPEILHCFLRYSIPARAQERHLVEIHIHDLRQYGLGNYRQIDDYPYGGGAGMVLRVEPYARVIESLQQERSYDEIILMSPAGEPLTQSLLNRLSLCKNLLILCGHYKGVDERVVDLFVTREISIGDYVISAGEVAAAVLIDGLVRLIPGVLGDEESALTDSFQDDLLAPPVYTRPAEFRGKRVPEVLRSGNHRAVETWRFQQALARTRKRRPDLYWRYIWKNEVLPGLLPSLRKEEKSHEDQIQSLQQMLQTFIREWLHDIRDYLPPAFRRSFLKMFVDTLRCVLQEVSESDSDPSVSHDATGNSK